MGERQRGRKGGQRAWESVSDEIQWKSWFVAFFVLFVVLFACFCTSSRLGAET